MHKRTRSLFKDKFLSLTMNVKSIVILKPLPYTVKPQSVTFNRVIASEIEQGWLHKNYKLPTLRPCGP